MQIRNANGDTEEVDDERGQELVNLGVAAPVGDVPTVEVSSKGVAEQELRWKQAESDYATPQEKRQAAVEQEHMEASGQQPRMHMTTVPSLAVPDEAHAERAAKAVKRSEEALGLSGSTAREGRQAPTKADQKSDADEKPATATATATAKSTPAKK